MIILVLLFFSFLNVDGKLLACENHSKQAFAEKFEELEKKYAIQKSRKIVQTYCDYNKKVMKEYDKVTKKWVAFSKEDLDILLKAVVFVSEKHQGKLYQEDSQTPYLHHIIKSLHDVKDAPLLLSILLEDSLSEEICSEEFESLFTSSENKSSIFLKLNQR